MNDDTTIDNERKSGRPVYLDCQATTPVDPRVLDAMLPFFTDKFGNPHSTSHFYGWEADDAVEKARQQLAALIGASDKEIVFTSGATESNNLAIKGIARFHGNEKGRGRPRAGERPEKNRIVTCATEHKCVLEACAHLARDGFDVVTLPVGADGLIELAELEAALTDATALVSIMGVNNEIGVIQPLAEIGRLCRERGVFFHSDCAQAVGKIPLDVDAMSIDLMSISGHKMYGPMGVGALYVRRRPRVRLEAQIDGGGQERGMRSGTLPAPLIVGLGEAAEIAGREMEAEAERLRGLRDRFLGLVAERVPDAVVNGDRERRVPGNVNVSFPGIQAEDLMAALGDVAVSSGSACTSASVEPSYVLRALGLDEALARASIRVGISRFTTSEEVDYAAAKIAAEVERLRQTNPRRSAPAA